MLALADLPGEIVVAQDAAADNQVVEAAPKGEEELFSKRCSGCGVDSRSGTSWFEAGAVAEWALPNEKGLLCRSCFSVWRLFLRDIVQLGLLAQCLTDPKNAVQLRHYLLAWPSLKKEDKERMRGASTGGTCRVAAWLLWLSDARRGRAFAARFAVTLTCWLR